ncbi:hypothetical protein Lal_00011901 [Lupinus albus]|nr:hypothetical protein Lal_00011901 [Lupinus albus]
MMDETQRKMWSVLMCLMLSCFIGRIESLSVTLNDVECVFEYVFSENDTISGNFVVVDSAIFWSSDHPGIDFTGEGKEGCCFGCVLHGFMYWVYVKVTTAAGNIVHSIKGTAGDKFQFKATAQGMHKFCFHNPYSTPETVSFYIHVGHIPSQSDLAKDEHLDPINVKIAELREALESVTAEQMYLRARDASHRHTNESTRKRVVFYTVGEYLLLAAVSALQVIYIRHLFGKSVAFNRV